MLGSKQGKCSVLLLEGLISPMKQTIGVLGFHQEKRMKGVGLCKFQILLVTFVGHLFIYLFLSDPGELHVI